MSHLIADELVRFMWLPASGGYGINEEINYIIAYKYKLYKKKCFIKNECYYSEIIA